MSLVDFVPDDFKRTRSENRINIICVTLFAVVMAAIVGGAWVSRRGCHRLAEMSRDVDSRYRQAGQQVAEIQKLQKARTDLLDRAATAARLIQPVPRYRILAAMADDMPDGVAFTQIKMKNVEAKIGQSADQVKNKFKSRINARQEAVKPVADKKGDKKEDAPELTEVEILINGLAENDEQVAGFLTHLRFNPMFDQVELVYSQQDERDGEELRSFQVTMRLDTEEVMADSAAMAAINVRGETDGRRQQ